METVFATLCQGVYDRYTLAVVIIDRLHQER